MTRGCIAAGVVIVVWGMTFASTRVLLEDFSSLEIIVLRFLLAWVALWSIGRFRGDAMCGRRRGLNTEICSVFPIGRQRVYNTSKQKHSLAVNTIARQ